MNVAISIDDLRHEEIRRWLERALRGREPLPLLTRDEFPHLGILRLEKTLKSATRDSLREGALQLVRRFCADGLGEAAYLEELLALASAFRDPEAVQMLARLAEHFPDVCRISTEIRLAVLAALVDMSPPQPAEFWARIFRQDPEQYAGLVLSGMLAINPACAIELLPKMPDTERAGQAAALKLDLAWDDLPPKQRHRFVQDVQAILTRCDSRFVGPVRAWANSKMAPRGPEANPGLWVALHEFLGPEVAPRTHTPKLCEAA